MKSFAQTGVDKVRHDAVDILLLPKAYTHSSQTKPDAMLFIIMH